ncbi:nuclear localization sequence binding protein [Phakopsora pachyrhizi]|uniref:Nuclear localization sequence binding protein n=1 Tax=Phakopsora pachyrhizi TaxID=170000 RepID=A0AAV0BNQ4_PHAPC|nr:nuclear localization sequence binding protein [Phakopsora pachyrhizi]
MEVEPIQELSLRINQLYNHPDPTTKSTANQWLQSFQKTNEAWLTSDLILKSNESSLESKLFAAQTFRSKITFDLDQLHQPQRIMLRDSLLTALSFPSIASTKVLLIQICLALADLSLQMPEWPTVVSDMITKFGKDPATVPILLQFLTVLPQEIMGNSKIRITNEWSSTQSSTLVSDTLSMYLSAQGLTNPIKTQIFICLSAWLRAGEIMADSVGTPSNLNFIFGALEDDQLFEPAVDLIVDLIHETQEIDDNMQLIERIVGCLITLKPRLIQDREDPDKMRGYCRIYVEAGEWYTPLILRLSKGLRQRKDDQTIKQLVEIYANLVETIIRHLHYPDDLDSQTGQENDDFRRFRHEIGDTLKDCCHVLGAPVCLRRSYDIILQSLSDSNAKWQDIEAALFSMRTMGAEVDEGEDEVLPLIMDLIPKLPFHPKIRYATILVLCRYTEWTNLHPAGIPFQLQYISSGFEDQSSEVKLAAAQAMKYLCRDCAKHLVSFIPQLFTFYQTVSSTLNQDDINEVTVAIAHIISAMPLPEASQAMVMFCMPLLEALQIVLNQNLPGSKELYQNLRDKFERLEIFLSVVKNFNGQLPIECFKTLEQSWLIIDGILLRYANNLKTSETVCTVLRRGLDFFGSLCLPLVPSMLDRLTISFQDSGSSSFMWITSKIVTGFSENRDANLEASIADAFEKQSGYVLPIFRSASSDTISDVIEDYIHLLTSMIENYPECLICSHSFKASFTILLASLEFLDIRILSTSLNYLREIVGHSSLEIFEPSSAATTKQRVVGRISEISGTQKQPPSAPIGFKRKLSQPIRELIGQNGYLICDVLLRRALDENFPEDLVSEVILIFKLMSENFMHSKNNNNENFQNLSGTSDNSTKSFGGGRFDMNVWIVGCLENMSERNLSLREEKRSLILSFKESVNQLGLTQGLTSSCNLGDVGEVGKRNGVLIKELILNLIKICKKERERERARERFS